MAKRLTMKATEDEISFGEIREFIKVGEEMGIPGSASVAVTVFDPANVKGGGVKTILFGVTAPNEKHPPLPKRRIKKKATKEEKQKEAVAKQIAEHKEKKAKGEQEAYVPPVGGPKKAPRIKCPVCNIRKPIVTVAGVKTIKPHVSQGEPCSGGSTQVVKSGKSWKVAKEK